MVFKVDALCVHMQNKQSICIQVMASCNFLLGFLTSCILCCTTSSKVS